MNETLCKLLESIGFDIERPLPQDSGGGALFLTNAVLCLKREGGMQGATKPKWFMNCAPFLRRTIEIVRPKVIVTLGEGAYQAIATLYKLKPLPFRGAVDIKDGFELPNGIRLFPVYHCGARILNTHRKLTQQTEDWKKIGRALELARAAEWAVEADNKDSDDVG
jgi:uracil-DNA glycosylase family 4